MRVLVLGMVAVGLLMAFPSIGITAKDEALVLYYDFEEGRGDTVGDKSGNGNDATIKGKLKWVDGKYGSALLFDFNPANYVDLNVDTFRLARRFSLAFPPYLNPSLRSEC